MAGLNSIILFTADPWESAMAQIRVIRPAYHAHAAVLCGFDRTQMYRDRIAQADLVVIERDFPRIPGFAEVIAEAHRLNKPIVYEIDDLLFEIPDSNIHHRTYLDALLRMLQAARLADGVITSSPKLKGYLGQINPNTWMIPNFLDDSLWIMHSEKAHSEPGAPVVIGYMGGHTHLADLESITPVLEALIEKYGSQIRLRFWGGSPPERICNRPQVEYIPMDMLDYGRFAAYFSTQSCDIFIAPLQNDDFNQYKSHIKFLEYSSLGIPGVYSQCESYQYIVQHGVTGFLAGSETEWFQYLAQLIDNRDLRHKIGAQAQESVKKHWLLSDRAGDWLTVYDKILMQFSSNPEKTVPNKDVILKLLIRAQDYQNLLKDEFFQLQSQLQQTSANEKVLAQKISEQEIYLQALKRTRSWRLIAGLQSIRNVLLPFGGKREAFLKKVYRFISSPFTPQK